MAAIRVNFALKDDDWKLYQEKLEKLPSKVKQAIDDYFHNKVKDKMIKSITGEMPISRNEDGSPRNKRHAKSSEWYVSFNFDQAVTIENKLSGGRKDSFYYLFFPHEGTRYQKSNPFMERAMNKEYDYIVTNLFNLIDREIKEDL